MPDLGGILAYDTSSIIQDIFIIFKFIFISRQVFMFICSTSLLVILLIIADAL